MMDSAQTGYRCIGRVVVRHIGSDTLLVPVSGPVAGGRIFPVNESALVVWNSLTDGATAESAAKALAETYRLDMETARVDGRECIRTFLNEGLLEEVVK